MSVDFFPLEFIINMEMELKCNPLTQAKKWSEWRMRLDIKSITPYVRCDDISFGGWIINTKLTYRLQWDIGIICNKWDVGPEKAIITHDLMRKFGIFHSVFFSLDRSQFGGDRFTLGSNFSTTTRNFFLFTFCCFSRFKTLSKTVW